MDWRGLDWVWLRGHRVGTCACDCAGPCRVLELNAGVVCDEKGESGGDKRDGV